MISTIIEGIKVSLYTDPDNFANDFFDIPDGAILDKTALPTTAGFACVDDNEIWIYKSKESTFIDLLLTVSHELGHLVEYGYDMNILKEEGYEYANEIKANHYESFVDKAYKITTELYSISEK